VAIWSLEFQSNQLATAEVAPDLAKGKSSTGTFKPTEDTTPVQVDPEDADKMVWIGASLIDKQESTLANFLCNN
jgi:hypothetical protein